MLPRSPSSRDGMSYFGNAPESRFYSYCEDFLGQIFSCIGICKMPQGESATLSEDADRGTRAPPLKQRDARSNLSS